MDSTYSSPSPVTDQPPEHVPDADPAIVAVGDEIISIDVLQLRFLDAIDKLNQAGDLNDATNAFISILKHRLCVPEFILFHLRACCSNSIVCDLVEHVWASRHAPLDPSFVRFAFDVLLGVSSETSLRLLCRFVSLCQERSTFQDTYFLLFRTLIAFPTSNLASCALVLPSDMWLHVSSSLLNLLFSSLKPLPLCAGSVEREASFSKLLCFFAGAVGNLPQEMVEDFCRDIFSSVRASLDKMVSDDLFGVAISLLVQWLLKIQPRGDLTLYLLLHDVARRHVKVTQDVYALANTLSVMRSALTTVPGFMLTNMERIQALPWPGAAKRDHLYLWRPLVEACAVLDCGAIVSMLLRNQDTWPLLENVPTLDLQQCSTLAVAITNEMINPPIDAMVCVDMLQVLTNVLQRSNCRLSSSLDCFCAKVLRMSQTEWVKDFGPTGHIARACMQLYKLAGFQRSSCTPDLCHELSLILESFPCNETRIEAARVLMQVVDIASRHCLDTILSSCVIASAELPDVAAPLIGRAFFQIMLNPITTHSPPPPCHVNIDSIHALSFDDWSFDDHDLEIIFSSIASRSATVFDDLMDRFRFAFLGSLGDSCASLAVWTSWFTKNAALALLHRRLRTTSLQSPQLLFSFLSKELVSFAAGDRPVSEWRICHLLVELVSKLEMLICQAYDGFKTSLSAETVQFFVTNKRSCQEFFWRIRPVLIVSALHISLVGEAIYHSFRRLFELLNVSSENALEPKLVKETIHSFMSLSMMLCHASRMDLLNAVVELGRRWEHSHQVVFLPWLDAAIMIGRGCFEDALQFLRGMLRKYVSVISRSWDAFEVNFVIALLNYCHLCLGSVPLAESWLEDVKHMRAKVLTADQARGLTGTQLELVEQLTKFDTTKSEAPQQGGGSAFSNVLTMAQDTRHPESIRLEYAHTLLDILTLESVSSVQSMSQSTVFRCLCEIYVPKQKIEHIESHGKPSMHVDLVRLQQGPRLVQKFRQVHPSFVSTLRPRLIVDLARKRNFHSALGLCESPLETAVVKAFFENSFVSLIEWKNEAIPSDVKWILIDQARNFPSSMPGTDPKAVHDQLLQELRASDSSTEVLLYHANWLFSEKCNGALALSEEERALIEKWLEGQRSKVDAQQVASIFSSEMFLTCSVLNPCSNDAWFFRRHSYREVCSLLCSHVSAASFEELLVIMSNVRERVLSSHAKLAVSEFVEVLSRSLPSAARDALICSKLLVCLDRYGGGSDGWFLSIAPDVIMRRRAWVHLLPQLTAFFAHADIGVRRAIVKILDCLASNGQAQPVVWAVMLATVNDTEGNSSPNRIMMAANAKAVLSHFLSRFPDLVNESHTMWAEFNRITQLWEEKWIKFLKHFIAHVSDVGPRLGSLKDFEVLIQPKLSSMDQLFTSTVAGHANSKHEGWFIRTCGPAVQFLHALLSRNPFEPGHNHIADHFFGHMPNRYTQWKEILLKPLEDLLGEIVKHWNTLPSVMPLEDVAPKLSTWNLSSALCLPRTVVDNEERIVGFGSSVLVLRTKTKPKKIIIKTSDGRDHSFILKGGEDLRLDQRLMQLFRLAPVPVRSYDVIPLGLRSGLIQVIKDVVSIQELLIAHQERSPQDVPLTEAYFHVLLKHLKSRKYDWLQKVRAPRDLDKMASEWAHLDDCLLDTYRELCTMSPKDLVSTELLHGSCGASDLLLRLSNYSKSLAATSMLGYAVGLGDRHLDNILLDKKDGSLVHIDLNVCFDRGRSLKVPELVPFRLTRNLLAGMSLGGVPASLASFQAECAQVMRSLRSASSDILNLLDVFCVDPVLENVSRRSEKGNAAQAKGSSALSPWVSSTVFELYAGQPLLHAVFFRFWDDAASVWTTHGDAIRAGDMQAVKVLVEATWDCRSLIQYMCHEDWVEHVAKLTPTSSCDEVASAFRELETFADNLSRPFETVSQDFGSKWGGLVRASVSIQNAVREKLSDAISVEQHVEKLIEESMSETTLSKMFHGWAAYI